MAITPEERERRRQAFEDARASVFLEGFELSDDFVAAAQRFIDGETDFAAFSAAVDAQMKAQIEAAANPLDDPALRDGSKPDFLGMTLEDSNRIGAEIAAEVRAKAFAAGRSISFERDGAVIRLWPDGREEVVHPAPQDDAE